MDHSIHKLSIEGFKSIQQLTDFPLKPLNILIGANGSGKSNLIAFFRMMKNIMKRNLQYYIQKNGGPDVHLFMGAKVTEKIDAKICFDTSTWELELEPTYDNRLLIINEHIYSNQADRVRDGSMNFRAGGFAETRVVERVYEGPWKEIATQIYENINRLEIYHFHDTSDLAKMKRPGAINYNERLDEDGGNLAAFLYPLYQKYDTSYRKIRDTIRLVAPFFKDFYLRPLVNNFEQIQFEWHHIQSDQPFLANQLSDGTLRFICLVTALLQPYPSTTVIIDEPELGLHPYALSLLADLIKQAAADRQIIVATQSATFLENFAPEQVIIIEQENNASVFKRLEPTQLKSWLEEYTLGELWQKNILGGRP